MCTPRAKILAVFCTNLLLAHGVALPGLSRTTPAPKTKLPFTRLVAFGDQYSDDGSGSWAHGLDPNNLFQEHTWTDGPVAVTYLAEKMNVSYISYAFGGVQGNGLVGSVLNNSYSNPYVTYTSPTYGPKTPIPSIQQQITENYTLNGAPDDINSTLHFIWAGQNDFRQHTNVQNPKLADTSSALSQGWFDGYSSNLLNSAETLVKLGSPAVVVVNLFPFQRVPGNNYLWCKGNVPCSNRWNNLIKASNNQLQSVLAASDYTDNIIYYDLYSFWNTVMDGSGVGSNSPWGYTQNISYFCNGNSSEPEWKWPICSQQPIWTHARPFFWFTLCQPETSMHEYIAGDVLSTVSTFVRKNQ